MLRLRLTVNVSDQKTFPSEAFGVLFSLIRFVAFMHLNVAGQVCKTSRGLEDQVLPVSFLSHLFVTASQTGILNKAWKQSLHLHGF